MGTTLVSPSSPQRQAHASSGGPVEHAGKEEQDESRHLEVEWGGAIGLGCCPGTWSWAPGELGHVWATLT